MPLIQETTDGLAFIDPEPASREAIQNLIDAELSASQPHYKTSTHPSIPTLDESQFSEALRSEHQRIESGAKRSEDEGVSTSRYEPEDAPASLTQGTDDERPEVMQQWREALKKAYTNSTYLHDRATNLELLDQHGKNAWLVANWQLEPLQRDLDAELAATKAQIEEVQNERRAVQGEAAPELEALEKTWREGVGRVVEVQVASETLRQQILEKRRQGAS